MKQLPTKYYDEYTRTFNVSEDAVTSFGEATGDWNRLHFDEEYSKDTIFKGRIAHGMLGAGFISATIAERFSDYVVVYVEQALSFRAPVRIDDEVTVELFVESYDIIKSNAKILTELKLPDEKLAITGYATIKLMEIE